MPNRRSFLTKASLLTLSTLGLSKLNASECFSHTPAQPLGPFYPLTKPQDSDQDLTTIQGSFGRAKGENVIIKGIVSDERCLPLAGAIVEIWQACESGKYNHPSDTSNAPLDPHFQYYGMVKTNMKGEYSFKTIIPGTYHATPHWVRPPHIHFKISLRGYKEVVTQTYFENHPLNKNDRILQNLSQEEQDRVIIKFNSDFIKTGIFPITLIKH